MKSITKDALKALRRFSPYGIDGYEYQYKVEAYNRLYNAMHELEKFGLITSEDFDAIVKQDHELFTKYDL